MTANHTGLLPAAAAGMSAGLGWALVRDPQAALTLLSPGTYGHGGRYGTYCFIDPKRDMVGIFMIHREGGSDEKNAFVSMAVSAVVE